MSIQGTREITQYVCTCSDNELASIIEVTLTKNSDEQYLSIPIVSDLGHTAILSERRKKAPVRLKLYFGTNCSR